MAAVRLAAAADLFVAQGGRGEIGVGSGKGMVAFHLDPLERAGIDQAAHHRLADLGMSGELADRALTAFDRGEGLFPLRGEALRNLAGRPILDHRLRAGERRGRGQDHPQHGRERREIIIGGPFGEPAQLGADRGDVDQPGERAQAIVANLLDLQSVGLPRDADQLARAERGDDHAARLDPHPVGHAIIERPERGVEGDHSGPGNPHYSLTSAAEPPSLGQSHGAASRGVHGAFSDAMRSGVDWRMT